MAYGPGGTKTQAGASATGQRLAARVAELVFTAQPTLNEAQRFYRDIKRLASEQYGRDPAGLLVIPGLVPFIGRTTEEARRVYDTLQDQLDMRNARASLPYLPAALQSFIEHVIPILQRRGIFQHEHAHGTLREKLGLPAPRA